MFTNSIRQMILRRPVVLPRGFHKLRGAIGEFCFLQFILASTLKNSLDFRCGLQKGVWKKKGQKRHCFRGLCHLNQKNQKLNRGILGNISGLFCLISPRFQGVIGNKCPQTCLFGMASLVTNAQKGMF